MADANTRTILLEANNANAVPGQPLSSAGALISATIAAAATFQSKWYAKSEGYSKVQALFYGSVAATLYVEESYDKSTVHQTYNQATSSKTNSSGAAKHIAAIDATIVAPFFRIAVINGGADQAGAILFAGIVSQ